MVPSYINTQCLRIVHTDPEIVASLVYSFYRESKCISRGLKGKQVRILYDLVTVFAEYMIRQ